MGCAFPEKPSAYADGVVTRDFYNCTPQAVTSSAWYVCDWYVSGKRELRAGIFFVRRRRARTPARGFSARFILPTHASRRPTSCNLWLV